MLEEIKETLGIQGIPDRKLLQALTHRSYDRKNSNERLELLGDAVLDLATTEILFRKHPDAAEGELSRRRAQIVREESLASMARKHHLGPHLRLGRGEAASGGHDKDSLLADTLEAIIGAMFLAKGYLETYELVKRLTESQEAAAGAAPDAKTALQEKAAAEGLPAPSYTHERHGPEHAPRFDAQVSLGNTHHGNGSGSSRKKAEQEAALEALRALENPPNR